ncbi:alpha-1,4-glucan--maltose-1-phosphate maltosyltransferase [Labrys wisconsinensis]|uniref:Alpha-1,4-glucan:maltose-1-phosphate maltosyltransferase n=1 Tax=Labrys wisconsinensis TaxID=425677 RepID=A0ABU0JI84_9HYPH|nr:alpha-1,4-glucan--maltose-1-phosphate maltosyltransferase [Labrys wisconsinensis]MDQ0472964.1 starch synthase (maltosyl-transferring) [Labrys wisconsinensis]
MHSIYFAYPSLLKTKDDWRDAFAHGTDLGFDSFAFPLEHGDIFCDDVGSAVALPDISALAAGRAKLLLDLRIDRVAAGSEAARHFGLDGTGATARDPRHAPGARGFLPLRFDDPALGRDWAVLLASRLARLAASGIAGFRCIAPDAVPTAMWRTLLAAARGEGVTNALFLAAPTPEALAPPLADAGFDGLIVPASTMLAKAPPAGLADLLGRFPRVLASPETPFGERTARASGDLEICQRQALLRLWTAASVFDGVLVPMGFELGARERVPEAGPARTQWRRLKAGNDPLLADETARANAYLAGRTEPAGSRAPVLLSPETAPVRVIARRDAPDGETLRLMLANRALDRRAQWLAADLTTVFGAYLPLRDITGSAPEIAPDASVRLRPGEVRIFEGRRGRPVLVPAAADTAAEAVARPRLAIEAVTPSVDGGRYAVKRVVGELVTVEADLFGEGHDAIAAALLWRAADETGWREARMRPLGNDRFGASLPLERLGRHLFTIEAWRDEFAIFRAELAKKHEAGLAVPLELEEGRRLVARTLDAASGAAAARLKPIAAALAEAGDARRLAILTAPETGEAMAAADPRPFRVRREPPFPIDAERREAAFASWYELFPRSQSNDPARHGTFADVARRLPAVRAMGFDVVYFPPIHPIGTSNRKGRNNSLKAGPDDPGSPYAIGSQAGGHDAIHPELGTVEDFRALVAAARRLGLEVALDFAIQASPDHPWLGQHPEWFDWRPDGSIRYAENPPKKYEDIVNVDFYTEGARPSLWVALRDVVLTWVSHGVRLFRVDNPHTKPFPFWEWLIEDIRRDHPDVVFLAEAFTRPKVMYRLAKIGFSQSYTYFTWRNTKRELTDYLTELTREAPGAFFRPHFFVNTPDINPDFLQDAPRSAFLIRAALATTLSGLWGMYNGFELCEGRPDARKKEYADSEKYELRAWDWDRPGNIVAEIAALNRVRRENPALHSHLGLAFVQAWNEAVISYEKATPGRDNVLLIAVSLDPHAVQETDIEVPLWRFGLPDHGTIEAEDLIRGGREAWTGKIRRIRLDPAELPFSIWRLSHAGGF